MRGRGIESRDQNGRLHRTVSHPAPVSRLACLILAAGLSLMTYSCAGRPRGSAPVRNGGSNGRAISGPQVAVRSGAPAWAMQPHSWGKLDAIEGWLRATPGAEPYWRAEAKLQLAEGQLRFADRRESPGTPDEIVGFRMSSALEGFEEVLADSGATRDQKSRANSGARIARKSAPALPKAAAPIQAAAKIQGLIKRSAWNAKSPNPRNMTPATRRWNWITVHHSVFSSKGNTLEAGLDTVRRIQRNHITLEKYADIGYHYLIDRAGRVIEGRSLSWQGAHAGGSNNRGNVGVCLLGNFDEEKPSKAAIASLDKLVFELQDKLRIPRKNVRPHKAWKETECPGLHLMPWFTRR